MPSYFRSNFSQQIPTVGQLGNPAEEEKCLAFQIVKDMIAGGFNVYAIDDDVATAGTALNSRAQTTIWTRITLIATAAVDPIIATDPWMIRLEVKGTASTWGKDVNGNNVQINVSNVGLYYRVGSTARLSGDNITGSTLREYALVPPFYGSIATGQAAVLGIYARNEFARISTAFPMSFRMTIVNRGIVLAAWPTVLTEDTRMMGIVCIQRGVNCAGDPNVSNSKPLYMVMNSSPTNVDLGSDAYPTPTRNQWYYQIIRATGIDMPYPNWTDANANVGNPNGSGYAANIISDIRELGGSSLNYFPVRWSTPVTNDLGDYILVFPFGLTSDRFSYSDEVDLIAVSKADAYGSGQDVPINVYNQNRTYTALSSNNQRVANNGGIRVFMLTGGPGV